MQFQRGVAYRLRRVRTAIWSACVWEWSMCTVEQVARAPVSAVELRCSVPCAMGASCAQRGCLLHGRLAFLQWSTPLRCFFVI